MIKAHTSHRQSPVDVQARQKPPWAKVHRPIRSMKRQAGTGNQANSQNLSYHFTFSQLAETKEVNWIRDKTILQLKKGFSASTRTDSIFKTYYNCLWMCKMFKCKRLPGKLPLRSMGSRKWRPASCERQVLLPLQAIPNTRSSPSYQPWSPKLEMQGLIWCTQY